MREINELTKRLLAQGYSEDHQPEGYIPYNKYYGGWQYSPNQQRNMVVTTPCGLMEQAQLAFDMGYMGIDWSLENDNVTVCCPYGKLNCPLNHELFRDKRLSGAQVHCVAKITDEPYDYEKSIKKIDEINHHRQEERIKEFAKAQSGFCRHQLCHNSVTDEYYLDHDPTICSNMGCTYCTLKKQPIDSAKGNVYYDLKITVLEKGNGLIPDELKTSVTKGIRFFDKNKSLSICRWIVDSPELIDKKVRDKYFTQLFFAKYHGHVFEYEILNIRAEKRESRDLEQDLQDIANGISVVHQSDLIASEKAVKHEKRLKAIDKKILRSKKLVEENGYENLEFVEQHRIQKLLDKGLVDYSEFNQWKQAYELSCIQTQIRLF